MVREKNRCLHNERTLVLSDEYAIRWEIRMQRTHPIVKSGRLYLTESDGDPIDVGTPAWYDWLEHHTTFTFVARAGSITVRKSGTHPGDHDWKASRTRMGKVFHVSLGPSRALTLSRLRAAAQRLVKKSAHVPSTLSPATPAASTLAVPTSAATVNPPSSLIQRKLYRPPSSSDIIRRTRLIERLNSGLSSRFSLVSAPAGFGKTTLLAEWVSTIDRPTAWLSLDAHDNELRVFVYGLAAALQRIFPDAFEATASLLKASQIPSPDQVATLLLNDLADVPGDVMLVLDDYHLIHTSEVHTLLELLIEHMPLHLHLVLIGRSDPPLSLAKWRANSYLNELRGDDLRFTLDETETFLTRVLGRVAAHEVAGALEERTEGWIALLRMAMLSLRSASDPAAFMERFRHTPDHSITSYLEEEILGQQARDVQELLVQMSMLEQFCTGLCMAILGSDAVHEVVQATLKWLERSNLFLVPLDERQGWYRFHHLFQQFLRQRLLVHRSTGELATLHRRASAWYAGQGLIEEALEHALAAGDVSSATHLVKAQLLAALEQEQLVQLERWLGLLPEEQIHSSPVLLVARVWCLEQRGQHKDVPHLLTTAEQLLETSDRSSRDLDDHQHRRLRAQIANCWCEFQYFTGQAKACLESARFALEWLPPGEEYVESVAQMFLAWSNQALGNEDSALVALQQALIDHTLDVNSTARLLLAQGWVYLAAGKLHQVEHTARHYLQIAQEGDLVLSQHYAHWLLGVVYYERNDLDMAAYHFSVVIANQHHAHLWVVRDSLCGLALTYQAQGLGIQAQEPARALLELVQRQNNIRELLTTYAFCGRLALLQNDVEEASQWLELAGVQDVLWPMMFLEDPPITTAHLLLAKGDVISVAQGQMILTHLLQHVQATHNTRKTIKVLTLQAWAYDLQGRETEALEVLEQALTLGRPGGFIRTFADLPPLAKVLLAVRKSRRARHAVDKHLDTYLHHIQVAMSPLASPPRSTEELLLQEGLEPLTERELNILHLLDQNLTNREIARELVVTPGTVKVHTNNVYRKLSVNNRHAAVTLARALGLLAANQAPVRVI